MARLLGKAENKIRKMYRSVIENKYIPFSEVPLDIRERYLSEYLLRGRLIDFSFLGVMKDYAKPPLKSPKVKELFREM